MYLSIESGAQPPYFKECAKHPVIEEAGFVLYYTDQCPYTYYWVPKVQEAAKEHGIPFNAIHITDKESAQNVPAPVTTYALFRDGQFLTQSIQSDKNSWRWQVYKIDFTPLFLSRNIMLSNEMEKKRMKNILIISSLPM